MDKYRADRDAQAAEAAQREKEQAAEAAKQQEIAQEAALQEQDRQEEDALERQAQRWATEQLDAAEAQRVAQQEQIGADQARWGTGRPDDSGKIPTGGYRVTHTFSDGDRVSDNRVSPETGLTPTETDILAKLGLLDEYNYQVLAASHHAQHDRRLDPRVYDETRVVDGLNKILAGVVENPALVGPGDEREWRKYWADRMYSMGERLAGREPTVIPQLPVVPEAVVTPEPPESLEPTPGPASEPANGWDMSGELDFSASGGSAEPLTGTVLPAANQQPVPPARYWEPARDGKAGRYVDDDGDTMYPGALPVPGNSAPQPEAGNTTESKELTPAQRDEMSKLSAPGYNGSVLEEWRNIARRLDNISRSPQNEDTQRQTDYIDQRLGEILDVLLANPVFAALGEDRILDALVQERLKVEAARKESAW
jgi:hypothetical protein